MLALDHSKIFSDLSCTRRCPSRSATNIRERRCHSRCRFLVKSMIVCPVHRVVAEHHHQHYHVDLGEWTRRFAHNSPAVHPPSRSNAIAHSPNRDALLEDWWCKCKNEIALETLLQIIIPHLFAFSCRCCCRCPGTVVAVVGVDPAVLALVLDVDSAPTADVLVVVILFSRVIKHWIVSSQKYTGPRRSFALISIITRMQGSVDWS